MELVVADVYSPFLEMWRRVSLEILPLAALGWGEDLFFIRSGLVLGRFFFILGDLCQLLDTLDGLDLALIVEFGESSYKAFNG